MEVSNRAIRKQKLAFNERILFRMKSVVQSNVIWLRPWNRPALGGSACKQRFARPIGDLGECSV